MNDIYELNKLVTELLERVGKIEEWIEDFDLRRAKIAIFHELYDKLVPTKSEKETYDELARRLLKQVDEEFKK